MQSLKQRCVDRCKVTQECFGQMTAMLQPVAPLAVLLEGGYNLSATAAATEACLRVLLGETAPALPIGDRAPSPYGLAAIQQVIRTQVCIHVAFTLSAVCEVCMFVWNASHLSANLRAQAHQRHTVHHVWQCMSLSLVLSADSEQTLGHTSNAAMQICFSQTGCLGCLVCTCLSYSN